MPLLHDLIDKNEAYTYQRDCTDDTYQTCNTSEIFRRMRTHCEEQNSGITEAAISAAITQCITTERLTFKKAQTDKGAQNEMMNGIVESVLRKFPDIYKYTKEVDGKITYPDLNVIKQRIRSELFGNSVLDPLIMNAGTSDIKVINANDIRVRIKGKAFVSNANFRNPDSYLSYIEGVGLRNGHPDILEMPFTRFVDDLDDDYRLRFSITMPRILQGNEPVLHIRKIPKVKPDMERLIQDKMLNPVVRDYLIDQAKKSKLVVFAGPPGCVDRETEYFNGKEWKSIADYTKGEQVLQYNTETGEASLTTPLRYIKEPCSKMYHFETKYGIDQTLSPEHRVLYLSKTHKGNKHIWSSDFKEISAEELKNEQNNGRFYGGFKTSFVYNGSGINLTDAEIKLMLAVIAAGSFKKDRNFCVINLKKQRKIDELRSILNESGIPYKENHRINGYTYFLFTPPIKTKEFPKEWYNATQTQLQLIADNVLKWDGSVDKYGKRKFDTTVKANADYVQFVFSAIGKRATMWHSHRAGEKYITAGKEYVRKSESYTVYITDKDIVAMQHHYDGRDNNVYLEEVEPSDGFKYCFTVLTHALVLRRNNKIFITGNSGKTTLLNAWLEYIPKSRECLVIQENDELYTKQYGWIFKTPDITYDYNGIPHGVTMEALGQMALVEGVNEIIIGEVKGGEMRSVATMLNSGCFASYTIHAENAEQVMTKSADLISAGSNFSLESAKSLMNRHAVIVYMSQYSVQDILECEGYDRANDRFIYNEIYHKSLTER